MKTAYEIKNERNNLEFDIKNYLSNHNSNTPNDLKPEERLIYTAMLERFAVLKVEE